MEVKRKQCKFFTGDRLKDYASGGDIVKNNKNSIFLVTTEFDLVALDTGYVYRSENYANFKDWKLFTIFTKETREGNVLRSAEEVLLDADLGDIIENEKGELYIVSNAESFVSLEDGRQYLPLKYNDNTKYKINNNFCIQEI